MAQLNKAFTAYVNGLCIFMPETTVQRRATVEEAGKEAALLAGFQRGSSKKEKLLRKYAEAEYQTWKAIFDSNAEEARKAAKRAHEIKKEGIKSGIPESKFQDIVLEQKEKARKKFKEEAKRLRR